MYDAVALGELLIDFTMVNDAANDTRLFQRNPGGAPANVLAALARLGKQTAFIGKVGQDSFGHFLQEVLEANRIDSTGLVFSEKENTTLAFVELDESGERSFTFYRKPGADFMLTKAEVKTELIENSKIFHFGSISLTHEPAKTTTLLAIESAKKVGAILSFDPNVRLGLWPSEAHARDMIIETMPHADIVKISEEELELLFHTNNLEAGTEQIWQRFGTKLILITLGSKGCFYRCGELTGVVQGFQVKTVDTNGAGDAFLGGVLYQIIEKSKPLEQLSQTDLEDIVRFGNATGALATTKKGAIPAMPVLNEVKEILASQA
jgi:fructokinase